jgi:ubiquinone/menaquinone biosynthesis C-methylase UbiE
MSGKEMHDASLAERVDVERRIWDKVRGETLQDKSLLQSTRPTYEELFTAYPEYRYIYEFFGPSVAGKRLLDIGAGSGVASVAYAMSGAHVTAVDISSESLRLTRERAKFYGVSSQVQTLECPAEELDFPDGSFDLFLGKSVVHHLIIDEAMPRLYRFLVPGGRGAIFEPRSNPVLDFAREYLPSPG